MFSLWEYRIFCRKIPLWLPSRPRGRLWSSPSCRRGLPYRRHLWNLTSKNENNLLFRKTSFYNFANKFYFFLVSERVAVVAEERVSPHHKNGQNWETKTPHNFPNHKKKQMYITQANDGHDLRHQKRIKSFKIVCRTSISPFKKWKYQLEITPAHCMSDAAAMMATFATAGRSPPIPAPTTQ